MFGALLFLAIIESLFVFSFQADHGGNHAGSHGATHRSHPPWLVNAPSDWDTLTANVLLEDVTSDPLALKKFAEFSDYHLARVDGFTDGEKVDALEHFFWGKKAGVALELGALDGSPGTRSMTYDYEDSFNWRRILVEGDPSYRFDTSLFQTAQFHS